MQISQKMLKMASHDYIPYSFIKQRYEYEKTLLCKEWKNNLPVGWIEEFICDGLVPFLKKKGYTIGFEINDCIQYCYQWAYAYVEIYAQRSKGLNRYFLKSANTDNQEEKDWFNLQFDDEEWSSLADFWVASEFLDDSEAGYAQRLDLSEFAWQLVDLNQSKAHWKWLDTGDAEGGEDVDYLPLHEESIAFGGDRRTL